MKSQPPKTTHISKAAFLYLLLAFLMPSCSLFLSPEEKARQLAVDMAVAFFTFDYQKPENWMEPLQKEDYYQNFIKTGIKPELVPFLQKYFVISRAEFVSVDEYARGINSENADVLIWKIQLQVSPAWPGSKPPAVLNQSSAAIPWTGTDQTTVYAISTSLLGIWNVKLIPENQVDEILQAIKTP